MNNDPGSCETCGSNSLEEADDGFFYCTACGTESRKFIATEVEVDRELIGGFGLRKLSKLSSKVAVDPVDVSFQRARFILSAFQRVLKTQARVLVDHCGCHKSLISVVGRLWFKLLNSWRLEGWGSSKATFHVDLVLGFNLARSRNKTVGETRPKLSTGKLSMPLSLAFCYLACQLQQEPFTLRDLINLARSGVIAYFSVLCRSDYCTKAISESRYLGSIKTFFMPSACPSNSMLETLSTVLASRLSLASHAFRFHKEHFNVPPNFQAKLNAPLIACRLLLDLQLPVQLCPPVLRLLSLAISPEKQNNSMFIMACIVIVVKLFFGLSSDPQEQVRRHSRSPQSEQVASQATKLLADALPPWHTISGLQQETSKRCAHLPTSPLDALTISSSASFLDFCRTVLFSRCESQIQFPQFYFERSQDQATLSSRAQPATQKSENLYNPEARNMHPWQHFIHYNKDSKIETWSPSYFSFIYLCAHTLDKTQIPNLSDISSDSHLESILSSSPLLPKLQWTVKSIYSELLKIASLSVAGKSTAQTAEAPDLGLQNDPAFPFSIGRPVPPAVSNYM